MVGFSEWHHVIPIEGVKSQDDEPDRILQNTTITFIINVERTRSWRDRMWNGEASLIYWLINVEVLDKSDVWEHDSTIISKVDI